MNLLDENILASQRELLRSWRIAIRQIGIDFQIISLLRQHPRTTFFTRDLGFYDAACATSDTVWCALQSPKMKWRSLPDVYFVTRNSRLKPSGLVP
jgi:hypothetical protein